MLLKKLEQLTDMVGSPYGEEKEMSMSKKHFIELADRIIKHNKQTFAPNEFGWKHIHTLADFCASQNPNFKRQRWLDYIAGECGPSGGAIK